MMNRLANDPQHCAPTKVIGNRWQLFFKTYGFWILFFVVQKPLFMIWQYSLLGTISPMDWLLVPLHGLWLDISVASYITAFVGLLLCISFWVRGSMMLRVIDVFTGLLFTIGLWIVLGDNGCFPSWGYHLDRGLLVYLRSPQEALACAPWWVWILGCVGFAALFAFWWWLYRRWIVPKQLVLECAESWQRRSWLTVLMLLLSGALFLPMRGSVTVSTMNTGRVYYSDNQMLNLAAVNPVFNIMESLGENTFDVAKYTYMPTDEAQQVVDSLLCRSTSGGVTEDLLTTSRPNIVLFILESFSLNAWDAMPQLQRISQDGIFFSNIFASSYRTDRGVVAVMSGFPGQPTSSLMTVPYKSQSLPQLGKVLKQNGYNLKFFYGGDEDFTNMRSYLIQGGFDARVSDRDFPAAERLSKWGVPDHVLFDRAAKEMAHRTSCHKHLDVILSLSSHEPFEVNYHHCDDLYLNSIAYTDSCLGAFMDSLRQSSVWDSTLVVMVADHGYPYPTTLQNYMPSRYRIPIVMAGGAVRQAQRIDRLGSQIDLVPTLLAQMSLPTDDFVFGKNLLDTTRQAFAFYAYNDGFGLIMPNDTLVVDAKSNQPIIGTSANQERMARALVQRIMETIEQL